ncbi:hypothetical protein OJ998_08820 [Solirubrobacter taibaiensis]|nr:hypothetical protein [Solirubrobacter taibaiensis]
MTIYRFGHGTPPGPQPDDVGLLWAIHADGRTLVAEPHDTRYMPIPEKLAEIKDRIAVETAHGDQLRAKMAALDRGEDPERPPTLS